MPIFYLKVPCDPSCDTENTKKEDDLNGSGQIEVIHTRAIPKLNSILKRRSQTISESSGDDYCSLLDRQCSIGSVNLESGLSEQEQTGEVYYGRRKTVSFSEYIEQTMFKKNQSVHTMRTTLKNRKKRARRRQQKETEKGNRKNSKIAREGAGAKVNNEANSCDDEDNDDEDDDNDQEVRDDDSGIVSCDDTVFVGDKTNAKGNDSAEASIDESNEDDDNETDHSLTCKLSKAPVVSYAGANEKKSRKKSKTKQKNEKI